MNLAHAHLLLNHLPVLGTAFGVLLLLFGLVRKSDELKRLGLGVFVVAAVTAVPAYLTGEPAADIVERLPGMSKPVIEEHEEAAETGAVAVGVLGAISLAGLVRFRRSASVPRWLTVSSLVAAVVVAALMARTATLGGRIHHPEIRPESATAQQTSD